MKLTRFETETQGLELYIDEKTGLAYVTQAALKRMFNLKDTRTLRRRLETVASEEVRLAEVLTKTGLKTVAAYNSKVVAKLSMEFKPELAEAMIDAGANVYLCGLAGYKVSIAPAPKSRLELAREQVKLLEEIERLEKEKALADAKIDDLVEDNERQAEVIDELFDYSSIIRIAKFNKCSEKAFNWRDLKAASKVVGTEIKKSPCPRFGTKNLYSHEAWAFAYPEYVLPEVNALKVN